MISIIELRVVYSFYTSIFFISLICLSIQTPGLYAFDHGELTHISIEVMEQMVIITLTCTTTTVVSVDADIAVLHQLINRIQNRCSSDTNKSETKHDIWSSSA